MKMKPEIKAKWTEALRSGEFQQGQGKLRTLDNNFCCLGVLCELHARATHTEWAKETGHWRYLGCGADLPLEVMEWAGLVSPNPLVLNTAGVLSALSDLNDGVYAKDKEDKEQTFPAIANLIEAQL